MSVSDSIDRDILSFFKKLKDKRTDYINKLIVYNDNTELLGAAHKYSSTFAGHSSGVQVTGHSSQLAPL